jgi:hypothetical protein
VTDADHALRRAALAVAARPRLWPAAAAAVWRTARPGWWHRWPPLPLPDPDYWEFRMVTAYGGAGRDAPPPGDVIEYLEWCRRSGRRSAPRPRRPRHR